MKPLPSVVSASAPASPDWDCDLELSPFLPRLFVAVLVTAAENLARPLTGSFIFRFMFIHEFCLHVCMSTACIPGAHGGQKALYPPGAGVTNGCEPPCGCWETNLGPPEKVTSVLSI